MSRPQCAFVAHRRIRVPPVADWADRNCDGVVPGDKNVHVMGGASTADQALRLGVVDELNLHIEPVLLGGGTRLFADLRPEPIKLERTRLIEGKDSTHLRFRVLR